MTGIGGLERREPDKSVMSENAVQYICKVDAPSKVATFATDVCLGSVANRRGLYHFDSIGHSDSLYKVFKTVVCYRERKREYVVIGKWEPLHEVGSLVTTLRSAKELPFTHQGSTRSLRTSKLSTHNSDIVINLAERAFREGKLVLNFSTPYIIPRFHNLSIQENIYFLRNNHC
ncbi:hypothetical protein K435DRAFT_801363 [Dendrothele bispora CBS 962.96]|uniref:Uncharacterized protein n=1 Tax=Dendrothele bispora (strain CBS 962.96) TaxID=1314807 RepID=A0A4S8LQX6_DENBC|nr:hypothetical protein K435DRAFT_801363 [Dendrothele bispora CBS 962.96]